MLTLALPQKINQRYTEATAESATLQELVVNELKSKKHVATEGLLWLTRCVSCPLKTTSPPADKRPP